MTLIFTYTPSYNTKSRQQLNMNIGKFSTNKVVMDLSNKNSKSGCKSCGSR